MGSTATSHCWRGRSTSIYANLPQAESSEDMFDFVFGDQKYPSNMSLRESMAVVSRVPCKEVCGAERGDVVCKLGFASDISEAESMSVSSSPPHAESFETETGNVVSKPQNDISIFATPLPEFVLEQRQRRISKNSNGSTPSAQPPPTCTIIEEGREWYGYRDEGIRQAAAMFGVTGPWIRPNTGSGVEDVDGIKSGGEDGTGEKKKGKPFWHGNGRKVGVEDRVQERWMCVGGDEFGIGEELVVGDEGVEGDGEGSGGSVGGAEGEGSVLGGDRDGERRKWWSVRWKNVFRMLGCGVLA